MSWDGYIDSILGGAAGHCDKAGIIGKTAGSPWTTDAHAHNVTFIPGESAVIAKHMGKGKAIADNHFGTNGVVINGTVYQYLRQFDDGNTIFAKKKELGCFTLQCSNTAIVIAHTAEGKQMGTANWSLNRIVEYLKGLNM